jgi:K+-transporting ATPase ATPase C chain
MKFILPALRMMIVMTVLTGLIYPSLIGGLSKFLFPDQAQGSLVSKGDQVIGSSLLAQKFQSPVYFWPRPSGVDYATLGSGGSNLGPTSADLVKAIQERKEALIKAHGDAKPVPEELLLASGSGLDPDISPEAADYQVGRVATARHLATNQVQDVVKSLVKDRQFGLLGEPRVNVLKLNLALDEMTAKISP